MSTQREEVTEEHTKGGRLVVRAFGLTWKGPMYPGSSYCDDRDRETLHCDELRATLYPPHPPFEARWRLCFKQPHASRFFPSRDAALEAAHKTSIKLSRAWLRKLERLVTT